MEPQPPITTAPTPVPPPATPKPKNNSFIIILLSVLLLLATSLAFFFALQTQKLAKQLVQIQVQPSPTPTADSSRAESKDWKTYTDEKYGFSFAYPQNWKAITLANSELSLSNIANDHTISLSVWRVTGFGYCYKYSDRKKIVVGGKDAETADGIGIGDTEICDQPKEVISKRGNTFILIPLGIDSTYPPIQIHISYDYPLSDINFAKSNLDQILSIFKFID